jgi:hypothetical protein
MSELEELKRLSVALEAHAVCLFVGGIYSSLHLAFLLRSFGWCSGPSTVAVVAPSQSLAFSLKTTSGSSSSPSPRFVYTKQDLQYGRCVICLDPNEAEMNSDVQIEDFREGKSSQTGKKTDDCEFFFASPNAFLHFLRKNPSLRGLSVVIVELQDERELLIELIVALMKKILCYHPLQTSNKPHNSKKRDRGTEEQSTNPEGAHSVLKPWLRLVLRIPAWNSSQLTEWQRYFRPLAVATLLQKSVLILGSIISRLQSPITGQSKILFHLEKVAVKEQETKISVEGSIGSKIDFDRNSRGEYREQKLTTKYERLIDGQYFNVVVILFLDSL